MYDVRDDGQEVTHELQEEAETEEEAFEDHDHDSDWPQVFNVSSNDTNHHFDEASHESDYDYNDEHHFTSSGDQLDHTPSEDTYDLTNEELPPYELSHQIRHDLPRDDFLDISDEDDYSLSNFQVTSNITPSQVQPASTTPESDDDDVQIVEPPGTAPISHTAFSFSFTTPPDTAIDPMDPPIEVDSHMDLRPTVSSWYRDHLFRRYRLVRYTRRIYPAQIANNIFHPEAITGDSANPPRALNAAFRLPESGPPSPALSVD